MTFALVPLLGLGLSPLALPDAVERALARDSALAALSAQQDAARSSAEAVRANYGPKLRLEGNVILWDDAQTVSFGGGGAGFPALPPPTDPYQEAVLGIQ
jgi:outer membrane protein TolC